MKASFFFFITSKSGNVLFPTPPPALGGEMGGGSIPSKAGKVFLPTYLIVPVILALFAPLFPHPPTPSQGLILPTPLYKNLFQTNQSLDLLPHPLSRQAGALFFQSPVFKELYSHSVCQSKNSLQNPGGADPDKYNPKSQTDFHTRPIGD